MAPFYWALLNLELWQQCVLYGIANASQKGCKVMHLWDTAQMTTCVGAETYTGKLLGWVEWPGVIGSGEVWSVLEEGVGGTQQETCAGC